MSATAIQTEAPVVFRARGVTKVYHMGEVDVPALAGVDLDLIEAEFLVLLGRPAVANRRSSTFWAGSTYRAPARCATAIAT